MSSKPQGQKKFTLLKLIAFLLSGLVVALYDYIPLHTVQIYPNEYAELSIFSDENEGGLSRATWIARQDSKFSCQVIPSNTAQYCGASITWSEQNKKYYDLRKFEYFILDVKHQGNSENFVLNIYHEPEGDSQLPVKYMGVNIGREELSTPVVINFRDIRVVDWWIRQNHISREQSHVELSNINAIGFAPTAPFSSGTDIIELRSLSVVGHYFSKQRLYGGLLIFWAVLLGIEALIHYLSLHSRITRAAKKLQVLADISAEYKVKAETDKLTGLCNREGLAQALQAIEQQERKNEYSLLLIDVDHFKRLNDEYGHDMGDRVLTELAVLLNRSVRADDLVCRWGGEEFIILFHYNVASDVFHFAEKIRAEIGQATFADNRNLRITVSIGAAIMHDDEPFEFSFKRADKALYTAKNNGRNRIILAH